MSAIIIWMDTVEAKLFEIDKDSINAEKIVFHGHVHPKETLGKNHPIKQSDEQTFYRQLIKKIRDTVKDKISTKILLMGPSLGVTHFSSYSEHAAPDIFKLIIGTEKVDRMPDSEILSIGRKYLQHFFLYHAV